MLRAEAEALIEHCAGAVDFGVEITDEQMEALLVFARLGLRVKWPSEADVETLAFELYLAEYSPGHIEKFGRADFKADWDRQLAKRPGYFDSSMVRALRTAAIALSALTEQQ